MYTAFSSFVSSSLGGLKYKTKFSASLQSAHKLQQIRLKSFEVCVRQLGDVVNLITVSVYVHHKDARAVVDTDDVAGSVAQYK
jgi:hypothetical protein